MQTIWIIGAGKFGQLAARRLEHKFKIFLIDTKESHLSQKDVFNITHIHQDGIKFLGRNLKIDTDLAWIIPCIPVHLAWEWCRLKLRSNKKTGPNKSDILIPQTLPFELDASLPNPMRGNNTDIYVSHANFICPDNCNEPDALCTKTKQPRKQPMHTLLEILKFQDYQSFVLKSHQIDLGIGGYRPKELIDFKDKIKNKKGNLLISTACRCHGVITGAKHIACEK